MQVESLKLILEAALMTADEPLSIQQLLPLFAESEQPEPIMMEQALAGLAQDYADRSVQLQQVASGYCFQVNEQYAPWVMQLKQLKPPKYSRALLETLAIIAYRQPATRAEIEAVRGVAVSSHIIKTLLDRHWVKIIGHREAPGRPALYATSQSFLDYFNLTSLQDLPALEELKDLETLLVMLQPSQADTQESDQTLAQLSLPMELVEET